MNRVKQIIAPILILFFSCQLVLAQEKIPFTIGESVTLTSNVLKEDRLLNIYLPHDYGKSDTKYHVIYLLDGSADEDFIHIAGLVQFASFSWIQMIPETIVVGISNVDRKKDFTFPSNNLQDQSEFPTAGHSAKFIQFIEEELQPYISSNYPVSDEKTIIGQSLGGLLAAEIAIKKPTLFNNYIIVSPSTWWDDESILQLPPTATTKPVNIYVGVGTEGPTMQTGATKLFYKIRQVYKDTESKVYYKFFEEQDHGDTLHLAVYDAFEKIFSSDKKAQ